MSEDFAPSVPLVSLGVVSLSGVRPHSSCNTMGAGSGGGGGGGGKGGSAPPVFWTGGAQGAPRNGTSTCRSLINIINHMDYL